MGRRRWRIIVFLMGGLLVVFMRVDGGGDINSEMGVDNCEVYISFSN
jgi:hypothetical protein